jgi:hypothetical protein
MTTLAVEVTWARQPAPDETVTMIIALTLPPPLRATFPSSNIVDVNIPPNFIPNVIGRTFIVFDDNYERLGSGRIVRQ